MMAGTNIAQWSQGRSEAVSDENKAAARSDPEEILSHPFPEDINNADLETLRREGKQWMQGGPEVDRETTYSLKCLRCVAGT
jgi:hypothetical protein